MAAPITRTPKPSPSLIGVRRRVDEPCRAAASAAWSRRARSLLSRLLLEACFLLIALYLCSVRNRDSPLTSLGMTMLPSTSARFQASIANPAVDPYASSADPGKLTPLVSGGSTSPVSVQPQPPGYESGNVGNEQS